MELIEKTLSSKELYKSRSYSFTIDNVLLPNGNEHTREVFHHPGAVAVLALNDRNQVSVVRQYRYPVKKVLVEIPAGKTDKDPNETIEMAARRELREETGCIAERFEFIGDILTSPGVMTEVISLFFATGLKKESQELDDDEFLNEGWMDLDQLKAKIASGEIKDAKTIIAVYFATLKGLI
ncbi:MAG: NUDIX hydrolase [Spirochaetales bacterium]|nr:NUDIX hydrolase [Spirochaetales bacterium]